MKKIVLSTLVAASTVFVSLQTFALTGPNVIGSNACLECHESEGEAWKKSHHFKIFKKFHKNKDAKAIAKKMGLKKVKKAPLCATCHYTVAAGKKKPVAGISCESCHGPAKNWVEIHNNYGGKDTKKEAETAAHKSKRIADAVKGGMIRPENIYDVANNCFQCHTVPQAKLVDVGGHKAGSDFELVEWSQGEVRHNFSTGSNKPASKERKRVLYVAGRVLDLEHGLRGLSKATGAGAYTTAMTARIKKALGHVSKINGALKSSEISKILKIAEGAKLTAGSAALEKAADSISSIARKYLNGNDGSGMAAVDGMVPSKAKGKAL